MEYKCIKKYPGGPALGTIAKECKAMNSYMYEVPELIRTFHLDKREIVLNSEYWAEVKQKEYEILSFKYASNKDAAFKGVDKSWNTFIDYLEYVEGRSPKFWISSMNDIIIHSVKRLSDNTTWTIGDTISTYLTPSRYGNIKKFTVSSHSIDVWGDTIDGRNQDIPDCDLRDLKVLTVKQVLFITEDGVQKYEGDQYYTVYTEKTYRVSEESVWKVIQSTDPGQGALDLNYIPIKRFHTKTAAEEYVLLNKPCLSINEVKDHIRLEGRENPAKLLVFDMGLKELVKQKLNK